MQLDSPTNLPLAPTQVNTTQCQLQMFPKAKAQTLRFVSGYPIAEPTVRLGLWGTWSKWANTQQPLTHYIQRQRFTQNLAPQPHHSKHLRTPLTGLTTGAAGPRRWGQCPRTHYTRTSIQSRSPLGGQRVTGPLGADQQASSRR